MTMSEPDTSPADAQSHTRWVAWTLSLLAVPVLYLLSVPPLVIWVIDLGGLGTITTAPRWLELYVIPADWLYQNTPLREPLDAYGDWCEKMMGAP